MSMIQAMVVMATAGALSLPSQPPQTASQLAPAGKRRAAVVSPVKGVDKLFKETDLEFYLTDDGIAYIRPGLAIKVNSVTIPADRRPLVDLTITDSLQQPLDRLGRITPGAVSLSFILARWEPAQREYVGLTTRVQTTPATSPRPGVSATQVGTDSGGTFTDLAAGHVTYKFRYALPDSFVQNKTYTIGIYSARNLTDILGKQYYANVEHDFRPDGLTVTETWDKIQGQSATCNNCHDPLSAHGGSRRDLKLCVMCHTSQTIDPDTGESVDMETMTHKIHFGEHLPSVQGGKPYVIIGNGQSVHDFSHVLYPQDTRNCDNCHEGITAAQKATQTQAWYTSPTKQACYSCHDNINLVTGEGHPGGPQADDSRCSTCHVPDSGNEFDAAIKGAHVIPEKSNQLAGLTAVILSISNTKAGDKPTVVVRLTDKAGNGVDGSKLASFSPMIGGQTSSYTKYYREAGQTRAVFSAATGNTTYTFTNAIPADATGTWVVSGDFYSNATIKGNNNEDLTLRNAAFNPMKYFAVTGTTMQPRRSSVTTEQCNSCHDTLALHGGQRVRVEECVICHNPVTSDAVRRPVGAPSPPESVSFQRMIHRIHRGTELTQDFTVYGNGNTAHNYNHVEYPGDLRNCSKCHTAGTQNLPAGGDSVITGRDFFDLQGPSTAACLGCHDSEHAAAHALLNTVTFPGRTKPSEACATCHGPNSELSADRVHAR